MLINNTYVNENAVIAMEFNEGRNGIPSRVEIYANCPTQITIKCSRQQFEQAVDSLHIYHLKNGGKYE